MRRLIRGRFYRWLMTAIIGTLAIGSLTGCSAEAAGAHTSTKAPSVVLSNAFIGNQWRQSMVDAFEKSAQTAVAKGLISSFKVANAPGQNSATDQIAQLKTILLEDPDILLIDPASPTALAPVISQACSLGITVVVFDSGIESNCAYVVTDSFPDWARESTEAIAKAMHGKGNLLISRGVVGSAPEAEYYAEQKKVLAKYPAIKVVGTVNGYCSSAEAQKAVVGVLSSLPKVAGVAGCGDGLGIAQAFQSAGRQIPVVAFEPSGRALRFWADNKVAPGSVAIMSDPGESVAALYTALEIRDGKKVPQTTVFPSVFIPETQRSAWLKAVGEDQIASWPWTQALVQKQIEANLNGTVSKAPLPPVPSHG